jgi:hypothetical protein
MRLIRLILENRCGPWGKDRSFYCVTLVTEIKEVSADICKKKMMKKNLGKLDRVLRVILSVMLIALSAKGVITGFFGTLSYVLALVFLVTSIVQFCPLYLPFGINTCEKK